ncbi:hypothetical protein CSA80_03560 [Candidatus Saccharibacteria bacterium]|nr:MAG: hypothetical protein CSA80_03560 [Candidatus Saccharibacteria bacterium]
MKWFVRLLVTSFVLTTVVSSALPQPSGAVTASDWKAGRIVDDGIFTNEHDMSVSDIQNFLNSKVPNCDTNGTQPASEYGRPDLTHAQYAASRGWPGPPYVCLRNYHEVPKTTPGPGVPDNSYNHGGGAFPGGVSAAQLIHDAAVQHRISPKVLLVKLGTESAGPLTTDTWPLQNQFTYAMGAHCPDSGPGGSANCDGNYAGFSIQISEAAALLRWYLDSMSQPWWQYKKPYQVNSILWNVAPSGCGAGNVYIESKSTAALYTYTPYQPNAAALANMYGTGDGCSAYGNRNFWRVFNDWFGRSSGSMLVQAPSSTTVYLLTQNKRFAIPDSDILYAYGLHTTPVEAVSDQFIAATEDGGVIGPLFMTPGDNTVYLADGGQKNGIASNDYCVMWGLDCDNPDAVKVIGLEIANSLTLNPPLQPIMKFSGKYYLMQKGKKCPFLSTKAAQERGYNLSHSTRVINWTNAIRPFGVAYPENNSFMKTASSDAIYLFSHDMFYQIPDYATFMLWIGEGGRFVLDTHSAYNKTPPTTSGTLRSVIKTSDGSISALGKTWTLTLPNASSTASNYTDLSTMPDAQNLFANRSNMQLQENQVVAIPSGTIVAFKNNELRPIPSMTDLTIQYSTDGILDVPSDITKFYPIGKLDIASGRPIRPNEAGGSMYLYGADKQLWALRSLSELNAANRWSPGFVKTSFGEIDSSGIKIYVRLVSIANKTYVVRDDGTAQSIPNATLTANPSVMPIEGSLVGKIPTSSTPIRFIRLDNGTIFAVKTNSIHPIRSFSTYSAMGGSPSNTASLPLEAVSSFKIGDVL